jgi:hypothetical protein
MLGMQRWLLLMHHGSLALALGLFGLAPSACGNDDPGSSSSSEASSSSSASGASGGGTGGMGGSGGNGVGGMGGMAGSGGMAGMGGMAGSGGMGGMGGSGGMSAMPKPDFKLIDTNPNSPTVNQEVSPSQFLGKVSAWYFGHGT